MSRHSDPILRKMLKMPSGRVVGPENKCSMRGFRTPLGGGEHATGSWTHGKSDFHFVGASAGEEGRGLEAGASARKGSTGGDVPASKIMSNDVEPSFAGGTDGSASRHFPFPLPPLEQLAAVWSREPHLWHWCE